METQTLSFILKKIPPLSIVSFFLKMVLSLFVLKYYPIAPGRINAKITVKLIIEIDIII